MSSEILLFLTTFAASAVEAVEALTIVLAVGVVRGWRSTLLGVGAAAIVVAAIVAALGPALRLIPIGTLRVVVGALLPWRVAVGLGIAIATWLFERSGVDAWWLLPAAVALLLAGAARRETRGLRASAEPPVSS